MASSTPPRSLSLSVEPDEARPSPAIQPEFKTPERKRDPSRPVPDITPLSRGSSMRQKQEGDTDRVEKFNREDYDDYIREDLKSRVFVGFEVFMKYVLHVPDDWETAWGPAMEAVKADPDFEEQHKEYCKQCKKFGSQEKPFYAPLMNTANAVLDVLSRSTFDGISPNISQHYRVNDPKKLRGGVFNKFHLSPDLVLLHNECRPSEEEDLHWANPLHILEVKPYDNALCDGTTVPRLVIDGVDPISSHAPPHKPLRYSAKKSTPLATSTTTSGSTSGLSKPGKRLASGSSTTEQRAKKKTKTKSVLDHVLDGGGNTTQVGQEDKSSSTQKPEIQNQVNPAIQVCRYLLELFSVPLLRSHTTVSLVDRDRLQLYHANRSVILVSSAINFSEGDGLSKFIAIIIAFSRLSFEQNGVLDTLAKKNTELVKDAGIPVDDKVVQGGNQLEFLRDKSQESFTIGLGNVISRDPAIIGRSTVVLEATSDQWKNSKLVVKISWPSSGRTREMDFLKKANEEAEKTAGRWATKHLPQVFYATDVFFDKSSTLESVARLFKDGKVENGKFVYERRTLRVIVQERLYPLKSLSDVREIGQVMLDVACVHRWLFDCPGILHRDLSPNNIMCRLMKEMNGQGQSEQRVYGVLTDYDLSSWKKDINDDYTRTSQQRTGTPPYMAHELLLGTSTTHLYRHDLESLFYIMLLMGARHTIAPAKGGPDTKGKSRVVMREGARPYQTWFDMQPYTTLGAIKDSFISKKSAIELSPAFEAFRPWLEYLRYCFSRGFRRKDDHLDNQTELPLWTEGLTGGPADKFTLASVPFDDETLGGHVDYSTIIEPARHLKGELKGLIIRYDTTSPPLPILTGAIQADT